MINSFIIRKLNDAGIRAYASFPEKRPDNPFTVIHKMEQGRIDHIDTITLDFLSYGKKVFDADAQDDKVKDIIFDLIQYPGISKVELGGGGSDADPANHLWQTDSIFNITYYKEAFNEE